MYAIRIVSNGQETANTGTINGTLTISEAKCLMGTLLKTLRESIPNVHHAIILSYFAPNPLITLIRHTPTDPRYN